MTNYMRKNWHMMMVFVFFIFFSSWWFVNQFILDPKMLRYDYFGDWADLYGIIAVFGGVWGLLIAKRWGGMKSIMGKAIIMFALGLFAQEFGQITYSLYKDFITTEVPYPSIGDLGFFGSIPLYIYGTYLLAKASGVSVSIQSYKNKLQAIVIPVVILGYSYYVFLQGYTFDWSQPVKIFFDFGYPLGQAVYLSIAILTLFLTRGILGGVMKRPVLLVLFALLVQYLSDYTFLYQASKGTWSAGGVNDYMYLFSYFLMTLALLQLRMSAIKSKLS